MEPETSRLDRLLKLIGEQNLPPKQTLTDDSHVEPDVTHNHSFTNEISDAHSADDAQVEQASPKWWEAPLAVARPSAQTRSAEHQDNIKESSLQTGNPAPSGISFIPFLAITKLPYKFLSKKLMQPIASAFFDKGKIWDREWDFYYIWSCFYPTEAPVTFVPEHQLLALVAEINEAFPDSQTSIGKAIDEEGLVISFDDLQGLSDLRPRWLGRSPSKAQYTAWTEQLTISNQGLATAGSSEDPIIKAFEEKMEHAIDLGKNRSKTAKARRQAYAIAKRQTMAKSLLRTQQYLGLLPNQDNSLLPDIENMSITPFNYNAPGNHPFDLDVVFIAIDVEAKEHEPKQVTEVGVATLDTRDLRNVAPGKVGENWQPLIRARHFRVAEYKHYKNTRYVLGCPENFEFGKSELVGKDALPRAVSSCFKPPFSAALASATDEKRNIVLVGHNVSQDINWLQDIGCNILNVGFVGKVDTVELHQVYSGDRNQRGLGSILYGFDLMGWHLHNGGNDAVYTIWAMLAMAVRALIQEPTDIKDQPEMETKAAEEQGK